MLDSNNNMIGTEIIIDTSNVCSCSLDESLEESSRSLTDLIEAECWSRVRLMVASAATKTAGGGEGGGDGGELSSLLQTHQTIRLQGHKTTAPPLHLLCKKKRVPADIVSMVIDLHPHAVRALDSYFRILPLHVACRSGLSVDHIERLVQEYPESIRIPDDDGNLPLHLACSFAPMDVILYLTQQCYCYTATTTTDRQQQQQHPSSSSSLVESQNLKNQTPLHLACSREDISKSVVKQLLDIATQPCAMVDWQGQLPLHKAVMWKVDCAVIELLLHVFHDAVRVTDSHGMTPYGICRKRQRGQKNTATNSSSSEPTIQLLRRYQRKSGALHLRARDALLRFPLEAIGDAVGGGGGGGGSSSSSSSVGGASASDTRSVQSNKPNKPNGKRRISLKRFATA
uniref:Uncharacterized protein n=1 Tax=Cyclophora tenuis TaxID=216820 RepID=A0A6U1SH93_CYCTE|mmetsp:Transcript_806/g.1446  ORF Transcript_806/g.1446 Transcript_806/m.1446 type:complete len:399 (+) Transcript_806:29-1225(+)